jgi:tRNA(His) 5'-end guanylyltransferase
MSRPVITIPIKEQPKEIQWLYNKRGFIKVNALEKELGMASSTLSGYFYGERGINEKWIPVIQKWVKEFTKLK